MPFKLFIALVKATSAFSSFECFVLDTTKKDTLGLANE